LRERARAWPSRPIHGLLYFLFFCSGLSGLIYQWHDHLMLSADFAQAHNLKANWGNGYSSVVIQLVPKLRHAGVKETTLRKILVDNPRRFWRSCLSEPIS
jgi:predicted metal-dependent phosphotriesterase family hydrolase